MRKHLALFFAAGLFATSPALAEIARVKQAQGQVQILRGSAKLAPKPGFQLLAQDRMVTGRDGRIALTFVDNTRFALGPNSDVRVSEFDYDRRKRSGKFVTQVDRGSLAVVSGQIAKSNRDAMKVRTPKTWLGVRGTRFVVTVP